MRPLASLCLPLFAATAVAQLPDLPVAVVAADAAAAAPTVAWLKDSGARPLPVAWAELRPESLRRAAVALLLDAPPAGVDPGRALGPLARSDRPLVLLGGASAALAHHWRLPEPVELATLHAAGHGPEIERLPALAGAPVWRQGHFAHVPQWAAGDAEAAARAALAELLAAMARIGLDRPILRRAAAPAAARTADLARELGVVPAAAGAIADLVDQLGGPTDTAARELLAALVDEPPAEDRSAANWRNWLRSRGRALVFDPLAGVWRRDPVAAALGEPGGQRRGAARRPVRANPPAARALAERIARHHGAAAVADLDTFAAHQGPLRLFWDRRRGLFRAEQHREPAPGAFATPWAAAVFDTAADADLLRGGGPPPRPQVSARHVYRELATLAFLPVLLVAPTTELEALPPDGEAPRLLARFAGSGLDPRDTHEVVADPATGALRRVEIRRGDLVQAAWRLEGEVPCGPLSLPLAWRSDEGKRDEVTAWTDPAWNPPAPAELGAAPGRILPPPR